MTQLNYHRYHCYNQAGKKIGKRVEIGQIPEQLPDHTPWIRGNGPFSPEALKSITQAIRLKFSGVPKSPEQKQKMRDAKLGKPKTAAHIANMKLAQQRRRYGKYL